VRGPGGCEGRNWIWSWRSVSPAAGQLPLAFFGCHSALGTTLRLKAERGRAGGGGLPRRQQPKVKAQQGQNPEAA
jgi:hypothetical protein